MSVGDVESAGTWPLSTIGAASTIPPRDWFGFAWIRMRDPGHNYCDRQGPWTANNLIRPCIHVVIVSFGPAATRSATGGAYHVDDIG